MDAPCVCQASPDRVQPTDEIATAYLEAGDPNHGESSRSGSFLRVVGVRGLQSIDKCVRLKAVIGRYGDIEQSMASVTENLADIGVVAPNWIFRPIRTARRELLIT
ncbi:hypothetical protein [Micromonospora schwarzwaldensis]|uniref:hypothetical protein n=1 Tax=Micromonospora sp. DSM 45708 TaxID=3111767 RepID=UPI0031D71B72